MTALFQNEKFLKIFMVIILSVFVSLWGLGCGDKEQPAAETEEKVISMTDPKEKEIAIRAELPENIKWLTNDTDLLFASPEAKKGGTLHLAIMSFPLTLRTVGPDSNSSFRSAILGNQLSLIGIHPNTENIVPEIATHWAFGSDKKTMYFKLNQNARWSDGTPVTSGDFAYTLEFMRSKHIVAPWYNDYYSKEIEKVVIYDDHILAVVATKAQPDLHLRVSMSPTPRHFYGELAEGFVQEYNWKIVPNTGPYQISAFTKGKSIGFSRKKDWWAKDLKFFKNRFNVDKVSYTVVRDNNMMWEYFKKGKVDVFGVTLPEYWHVKSKTPVIEDGYVERVWFYNDRPRTSTGLWLNQDMPIFKDRNVRYAFAHAMNIQKVIEQVLRNDFMRLDHGTVGYGRYTNDSIKARKFDLDLVDFYMKESGWERGKDGVWAKEGLRFAVELTYGSDTHTPQLIVLKEEAKKAGVELKLQLMDPTAWFGIVAENKHVVILLTLGTNLRPSYWQTYHSDNAHKPQTNNITNTDDPEMDKLIDAFRNSLDEDERIGLAKQIQEKIHEVGAFVPTLMVPYVRQAYWRWWRLPEVPGTKLSESLFGSFDSATGGLFWYDKDMHEDTEKAMKEKRTFSPVTNIDETFKISN